MPDTGAPWSLPYPAIGDAANGPAQIGALAAAVEAALDAIAAKVTVSGRVSNPFTAAPGWSLVEGVYRPAGIFAVWRLAVSRTGSDISVSATGDISNLTIGQLANPPFPWEQGAGVTLLAGRLAAGVINTDGSVTVGAVAGSAVIATGTQLQLGGICLVSSSTPPTAP